MPLKIFYRVGRAGGRARHVHAQSGIPRGPDAVHAVDEVGDRAAEAEMGLDEDLGRFVIPGRDRADDLPGVIEAWANFFASVVILARSAGVSPEDRT